VKSISLKTRNWIVQGKQDLDSHIAEAASLLLLAVELLLLLGSVFLAWLAGEPARSELGARGLGQQFGGLAKARLGGNAVRG